MEIEIVRRLARRLQERDRRTPAIAVLAPDREIMQRGETDEIARGNHRGARDIGEIAGQLRPEAGLGVHVLAHGGDAEVLQLLGRVLNAALHVANGPSHRQNGQVMFAQNRAAR